MGRVEILRPAIPATHFLARRRQASLLAERFQQGILIERHEEGVVGAELIEHRAVQQFHVAVIELRDPGRGCRRCLTPEVSRRQTGSGCCGGPFQETPARMAMHDPSLVVPRTADSQSDRLYSYTRPQKQDASPAKARNFMEIAPKTPCPH